MEQSPAPPGGPYEGDHSAAASALGYLYQCRLALAESLRRLADGNAFSVSIEALDDVVFEPQGTPLELLQTKHHIRQNANLTDASTELWATLRVWCDAFNAGTLPTDSVMFLVSTSSVPSGSAASYLTCDNRRVPTAVQRLTATATTSQNTSNATAYQSFLDLTQPQREQLLSRATIIGASPTILDLDAEMRRIVFYAVERTFHDSFIQRLEGWWWQRVVAHLSSRDDMIHSEELDTQQNELREQFKRDNLPVDDDIMSASVDASGYQDMVFVQQMRLIEIGTRRIVFAIRDYFRAFEQRSRWMREELLFVGELERYEDRLQEEWERLFEQMRDELGDDATEEAKRSTASSLFKWVESGMHPSIRPGVQEPTIARGSYQMLSDDQRVGWHIEFRDRLATLLSSAETDA